MTYHMTSMEWAKTTAQRETFKFFDLVRLILEVSGYALYIYTLDTLPLLCINGIYQSEARYSEYYPGTLVSGRVCATGAPSWNGLQVGHKDNSPKIATMEPYFSNVFKLMNCVTDSFTPLSIP